MATDLALAGVRLTYPPRSAGRLRAYGRAVLAEPGLPGYTTLGRPALVSRGELLDTIIHEEVHHRLWLRAQRGSRRAWDRIADLDREGAYVETVAYRFLQAQDYQQRRGRK